MEAERLLGEVQGEMPMAWTSVEALDRRRSSRAIDLRRSSHTSWWQFGCGQEGKAGLKIDAHVDRGAIFLRGNVGQAAGRMRLEFRGLDLAGNLSQVVIHM